MQVEMKKKDPPDIKNLKHWTLAIFLVISWCSHYDAYLLRNFNSIFKLNLYIQESSTQSQSLQYVLYELKTTILKERFKKQK